MNPKKKRVISSRDQLRLSTDDNEHLILTLSVDEDSVYKENSEENIKGEEERDEEKEEESLNKIKTFPINNDYYNFTVKDIPIDNFKESTDIHCWWCCHQFGGDPIPIATYYNTQSETFKVYGNFCSFSCAKTFLIDKKTEHLLYLLNFLQKRMTGKNIHINNAPPRIALKMFGGPMTIEEFRNNQDTISVINKPFLGFESQLQYVKIKEVVHTVPKNSTFKVQRVSQKKEKAGLSKLGIKTIKKAE